MNFGSAAQDEIYQEVGKPKLERLPVSYEEWEERAREVLPAGAYDYAAGGAGAEDTLKVNREAFYRWRIVPRLLTGVAERDLSIQLFGKTLPTPIILGTVGRQRLFHPAGELATARAAASMRVPFTLATVASNSIEQVAATMGDSMGWFQLYVTADVDVTQSLIRRAENSGYSVLVVSISRPQIGWRERDLRNAYFPTMFGQAIANYMSDPVFLAKYAKGMNPQDPSVVQKAFQIFQSPGLTWEDLSRLRHMTSLPIVVKGIMHPHDAELALKHGADGIVVSNHGGRHLDGAEASLNMLPYVCDQVKGRVPVLMDSGVRRGADVVKALALGAKAVLIAKYYVWGLAVAGQTGVRQVIRNLVADTDLTMANAGQRSLAELNRSLLVRA